jgi:hypothetical protein
MYLIDLPTYINAKLKAAEMTSDEYFCQQCDDSQGYCEEQANAANQVSEFLTSFRNISDLSLSVHI